MEVRSNEFEQRRSEKRTTKKRLKKLVVEDCSSKNAGTKSCCAEDTVYYQDQVERGKCFRVEIRRELVRVGIISICCGWRLLKEKTETLQLVCVVSGVNSIERRKFCTAVVTDSV